MTPIQRKRIEWNKKNPLPEDFQYLSRHTQREILEERNKRFFEGEML